MNDRGTGGEHPYDVRIGILEKEAIDLFQVITVVSVALLINGNFFISSCTEFLRN